MIVMMQRSLGAVVKFLEKTLQYRFHKLNIFFPLDGDALELNNITATQRMCISDSKPKFHMTVLVFASKPVTVRYSKN
jgi:hypothetical protein